MRRRRAHGAAAAAGATIVYEPVPSDELRAAPPEAAAPVERRPDGSVTSAGAAELARMRWEVARLPDFAERELDVVPAESFAPFDRGRRELIVQRRRELSEATGGVSCAVGTMIRGAAWMTAFAEHWAAEASRTGDAAAADRAARFFRLASVEHVKALDVAVTEARMRVENDGDELRQRQAEFQRVLAERAERGDSA